MKLLRRAVVVVFTIVCPAIAHAQKIEPKGLIEQMSGPGPFTAWAVSVPVACAKDFDKRTSQQTYRADWFLDCASTDMWLRQLVEIRVSRLTSDEGRPRFSDTPSDTRRVKGLRLDARVNVRLNPAVDVGAGLGFIRFWGEGFTAVSKRTWTPAIVTITPLTLGLPPGVAAPGWRRILSVYYEALYIPNGFTGRDFGNTTTSYSTGGEYLSSVGYVIDVRALIDFARTR